MNNFKLRELVGNNELESYVSNVRVGENRLGKVLYFETSLKYVDITHYSSGDLALFIISPEEVWSEEDDRALTHEDGHFYDHEDYFCVEIQVPSGGKHISTLTTALKHQYFINLIDTNDTLDYEAVGIK
jgi:hypothetical protein